MQKYYLFSNQQSFKHKITYSHLYTCHACDSLRRTCMGYTNRYTMLVTKSAVYIFTLFKMMVFYFASFY